MIEHIYTVCTGRCGQVSLSNYVNKFSTNAFAEAEPPMPKYKKSYIFSNFVRYLERKTYASDELLGRGKALIWHDNNDKVEIDKLCNKRIRRANKITEQNNKEIYFEISKFFIRSYCERTIQLNPSAKILYLTRNPLANAVSFFNRNKIFEKDNFDLDFKKNIFKIKNLDKFEKYLWIWIEIKLRLLEIKKKYNSEIIHFKSENINNIVLLKKLFEDLELKYKEITIQKKLNTNVSSGYSETIMSDFFISKFENFKKKIPEKIKEKVPEFFDYDRL